VTPAIRRYDTLDSTNEEAKRLSAKGETGPLWIVTGRQTQGRGRRGNEWVSPPGNLTATLLTPSEKPEALCAPYAFAAALSIADLVGEYADARVSLKWPNDVLLEGKKVAGVLLETVPGAMLVGIGVNLAGAPENTPFPATSIAALTGMTPDAGEALIRLSSHFANWEARWRDEGFAPLRDAWLARAAHLGAPIRARLAKMELTGIFEDLDAEGALMLRTETGALTRVTAGEVFF